jgi:hypothetical protein
MVLRYNGGGMINTVPPRHANRTMTSTLDNYAAPQRGSAPRRVQGCQRQQTDGRAIWMTLPGVLTACDSPPIGTGFLRSDAGLPGG